MKKYYSIVLILFLFCSCSKKGNIENEARFNNEFYSVLNELVKSHFKNVSVIYSKTMPVYKTKWGDLPIPADSKNKSPQVDFLYYSNECFSSQISLNNIDFMDAMEMYNSIDSTKIIEIDPAKTILPVITKEQKKKIFEKEDDKTTGISAIRNGFMRMKKIYGTSCYMVVSTPIFNSDFSKVIITADYICGPLNGQGGRFVLVKKNGKWQIANYRGTWVS